MLHESWADWLERIVGPFEPGTVCLVGAGPGDPGLISIRGAVRLRQADVILYDRLVDARLLRLAGASAELVCVGKQAGQGNLAQDEINRQLIQRARAGARVVRLKGGDPFVFGRGGEECEALAAQNVAFEVVPGITAAIAAPAYAGIPVTHRAAASTFALATGHEDPAKPGSSVDFAALARMGTVALYMSVGNLQANCRELIRAGLDPDTPAAVIQNGTLPTQRTVAGPLSEIADRAADAGVAPPAMLVIGRLVALRDKLAWFESRPLFGRRILVTRPQPQAAALAGRLMQLGADVIEAPTIAIEPFEDTTRVDEALRNLRRYDWLILTSVNGVEGLVRRLQAVNLDARALAGVRLAAIGPATAAKLRAWMLQPDLVAASATSRSLAEALTGLDLAGKRCLLLRADIATPELPEALRRAGAVCDDLPIYRTTCPARLATAALEALQQRRIDWITFTSASTVRNFVALLGKNRLGWLEGVRLASIGPVTSRALREHGLEPTTQADPHTIPALVSAICKHTTAR